MLTLNDITWLDLFLVCVRVYLAKQMFTKKNPAPYPPGPAGWPLIDNILDVPRIKPCLTFVQWGDIMHVQVLGQHIIVLNSVKTAMEMLDNESAIYSDCPVFPMGGKLVVFKDALPFLSYGDHFCWYHKNLHCAIGNCAAEVDEYKQIEEAETCRFLKCVLVKPDQLQEHVRYTAGAIILRISYGYQVKENNDPFIDLADHAMDRILQATTPSAFMVDILPLLTYIPTWFSEMVSTPYKLVKDQMATGIAPMSFTSNLLEGCDVTAEEDHIVKWSAFSLYSGGADTTISAIYSLFLAMMTFPDLQKKAQAEIDTVAGPDQLPSFADCFPHCVTEDDIHDGYYIPKGSMVLSNIWFMLNDQRTYAKPLQFNPEHFLANDGKQPEIDPRMICFSFGRHICPGLHLADVSIWISAAMSLAMFDIFKIVENGVEITPEFEPLLGSTSHPKPFKCSIKPHSVTALGLIQQDAN
ncbi:cytochrome P450 [Suillus occidentalis]|nr:cytochrome P450 [Suillus occidentalis]